MRPMNSHGVEMLPIRLMMSMVLIAAVAAVVMVGSQHYGVAFAQNSIQNQLHALQSTLLTMHASGVPRDLDEIGAPEGTCRVQTFILPDTVLYVGFGVDPDPDNTGGYATGLMADGAMLCYRVQGGSKHLIWFPEQTIRFREGAPSKGGWLLNNPAQGFVLQQAGKTLLVFEMVTTRGEEYILIHSTDGLLLS